MHWILVVALQDGKAENFGGPVPGEIARSRNGRIVLESILGSRR